MAKLHKHLICFLLRRPQTSSDGKQTISFSLQSKDGQKIEHQYTLHPMII